ncbi:MAG: KpsF/GutQ family sugar-phosphate isomerase, partial [Candidatus Kapabacteria bacterium]|nr:KpsF/GutQ family sugar-phosphate isomerase [Candidatus Kapabacteria bacterium]
MTALELQQSVRDVLYAEAASLDAVAQTVDSRASDAVTVLLNARNVIVTGIGKSGIIAHKIAATLTSVGFRGIVLHPVEALHGDIGIVGNGDVVIMLSNSGTTPELVTLLPYLRDRGALVIGIIGKPNSPLAAAVDIPVLCSVIEDACPLGLAPGNSTTAMLALGDALVFTAMKAKGVTREQFAHSHPLGQIGKNLTLRVSDVMHTGEELPLIGTDATFKEAIIEVSRKKLGCVCVVDGANTLAGIITDGDV